MDYKGKKYHEILAQYFHAKECFLEPIDEQRIHAQHQPPSPRKIYVRKVMELPWQESEAKLWSRLEDLLTDLFFVEAKAEAGKIFDLADDFANFIGSTEEFLPDCTWIKLLEEVIRADIHFISKHPTTIFQCLWNSCSWFDNPYTEIFFESSDQLKLSPSGNKDTNKIYELMERWRLEKCTIGLGNYWARSLRPFHQLNATSGLLVLRGHLSPVTTAEFSPKGNLIASGSAFLTGQESFSKKTGVFMLNGSPLELEVPSDPMYLRDNTIRLWNSKNAMLDYSIKSLEGPVLHCTFSPDGKFVACTCLPDGNIHIFDIAQRNEINCLYGSGILVSRIAFSPDGMYIASGGIDGCIRIRETLTGADENFFKIDEGKITDIKYSPDGRFLAFSSRSAVDNGTNNSLKIIDSSNGKIKYNFSCEPHCSIMCISFLPDGQKVVGGTFDHEVMIYNLKDGSKKCIGKHEGEVLGIAVSSDGRLAASGSTDTTVKLWNLENLTESTCFYGHNDLVNAVSFSPDGLQIASGSADCTVRIWPISRSEKFRRQLIEHKRDIRDLRFSKSGKYLVSGSEEGRINLYDDSGICLKYFENCGKIFNVKFTNKEDKLISTDKIVISIHDFNGKTFLLHPRIGFNIDKGKDFLSVLPETTLTLDDRRIGFIEAARFEISDYVITNDDSQVIAGCWNGSLRIWNLISGSEICLYQVENEKPVGLRYSVNEQRIVYSKEVTCMALSANNEVIAIGAADGTVRAWDLKNSKGLSHLRHSTKVNSIAFSPDNSLVASGDENGEIFIWEFPGNSFRSYKIHENPVLNIVFGQNSNCIFSTSSKKTAITDLTSLNTKFLDGKGDVGVISTMADLDSPVPFVMNGETVITDPTTGHILAWFPSSMKYLCSHPGKSVWAGAENNQLRMFTLEKYDSRR